jgi:hypothetical protein
LGFAEGLACAYGAKANVPFAGRHKIELKKMCGGENKKYRSVGNECRLTRCPFEIWSVCLWSPVKMVYFFLVYVRFCLLCRVVLRLLATEKHWRRRGLESTKVEFSTTVY